jgi:hypothetical protein
MRGDLSETPAADACRDLAGDGVTGVLWIDGPDGPGSVTFVQGRIVGATSPTPRARLGDRLVGAGFLADEALHEALETQRQSSGRSRLGALLVERTQVPRDAIRLFVQEQTLDAMFEVLRWRFGSFSFEAGEAAAIPEIPVAMTVDQALVEVARRQQQWRELSEVIPDLEAVPTFSTDPASAVASLEPDEFAVLASVDGDRSVRTLAADLGYGEFELARIVYGLVLLGVVEIELPEDEIGAALDDAMSYAPPGDADPTPEPSSVAPKPAAAEPAAAEPEPLRPVVSEPGPSVSEPPTEPEIPAETPGPGSSADATGPVSGPAAASVPTISPEDAITAAGEPVTQDPSGSAPATSESAAGSPPDDAESPPDEVGSPPDDASAGEPQGTSEGAVRETDLPERTYSDVFRELRGLDGGSATPSPPAPPSPPPSQPAEQPPEAASVQPEAAPRRPARSAEDGDVSEFLRELSRLAIDEQQAEPERPRRSPPPASDPKDDDSKRKRRGLFGRG